MIARALLICTLTAAPALDAFARPSLTTDASLIAFDLERNGRADIYIADPATQQVTRLTANSGEDFNGDSRTPHLSRDGRYVTFTSTATNIVPDADQFNGSDVYVYDRYTNQYTRVSVAADGSEANGDSASPSISADGRYVSFSSVATNLTSTPVSGTSHVHLRDRLTGVTSLVSTGTAGGPANDGSFLPVISANGAVIAYESLASDLIAGDTNGVKDVFAFDRTSGITTRVSMNPFDEESDSASYQPSISADGNYVSFSSAMLSATGVNSFKRSRDIEITSILSELRDPEETRTGDSVNSSIGDTRYGGAFQSTHPGVVDDDTNELQDVFVRDPFGQRTILVSKGPGGMLANGVSSDPFMSGDARHVAFVSEASNLVPGDTNGLVDVFLWYRDTDTLVRIDVN